jgi:hypothetical protein
MKEIIVLEYNSGPIKYMYFWPHHGDKLTTDEHVTIEWQLEHRDCKRVPESRARELYRQWRPTAMQSLRKIYHNKVPKGAIPADIEPADPEEWNWSRASLKAVV